MPRHTDGRSRDALCSSTATRIHCRRLNLDWCSRLAPAWIRERQQKIAPYESDPQSRPGAVPRLAEVSPQLSACRTTQLLFARAANRFHGGVWAALLPPRSATGPIPPVSPWHRSWMLHLRRRVRLFATRGHTTDTTNNKPTRNHPADNSIEPNPPHPTPLGRPNRTSGNPVGLMIDHREINKSKLVSLRLNSQDSPFAFWW